MLSISVIVPIYNRVHLLPYYFGSILCQILQPFQIIVVDDGRRVSKETGIYCRVQLWCVNCVGSVHEA